MRTTNHLRNVPVSANLHPGIYGALVGSVIWITLAIWLFFGHETYAALQLAVVTVFATAFIVTPVALWRLSSEKGMEEKTLRDWFQGELDTCTGKVHGSHAAVMVLLAPLACAAGITGVSVIARLAAVGAL